MTQTQEDSLKNYH